MLLLVLIMFIVVFPVALFPAQANYAGLVRAIIPIVAVLSACTTFGKVRWQSIVTAMVIFICAANLPFVLLSLLSRYQTNSLYRVAQNEATEFTHNIRGTNANTLILVPTGVYFLYKPLVEAIIPEYVDSLDEKRVGAEVACYYGRRLGTNNLSEITEQLSKASSHYAPHLFGIRLMKSEWGWSCDTYLVRKSTSVPSPG